MNSEGCWSTVVVTAYEQQALGLAGTSEWILQCRLAVGHRGNHATDASTYPRSDRRPWLEWNDHESHAQSLIQRNPCPVPSPEGTPCVFFHGHGGPHFYARSNGHAPSAMSGMSAAPGSVPPPRRPRYDEPRPSGPPGPSAADPTRPAPPGQRGPATGDLPVAGHVGSHRLGEPVHRPRPAAGPAGYTDPGAPLGPGAHGNEYPSGPRQGGSGYPGGPQQGGGYQGGHRSTDIEPPEHTPYHGRRHRLDDPAADGRGGPYTDAGLPAAAPMAGAPFPGSPLSEVPLSEVRRSEVPPSGAGGRDGSAPEPAPRAGSFGPAASGTSTVDPAAATRFDGSNDQVGAALDDVVAALAKLADALRRR